jgi:hypothetical protein
MRLRFSCAALLLSLACCVRAQNFPESPGHRFWDRTNIILITTHAALESADFAATHHNLSRGGQELDCFAKPFCERGTAGQFVFFAGQTAGAAGISYLLHKSKHHKLERWFMVAASVNSAYGAAYSFSHR